MRQEKVMLFRNHNYLFSKHESKDQMIVMQIQILQFCIIISFDSAYCRLQFKKTLTC